MAGEARSYASPNEARVQLQQLFNGKAVLLVLDDLWRLEDAEPFDVLGPRSRLLVTTRDADLLVALGAREMPVDVLKKTWRSNYLRRGAGGPRTPCHPGLAKSPSVAAICHWHWPLPARASKGVRGGRMCCRHWSAGGSNF